MKKLLWILGSACVVLLVVVFVILQAQLPHSRLPYTSIDKAAQVTLTQGTNRVVLVRRDPEWVVSSGSSTVQVPVESTRAKGLRTTLQGVHVEDEISDREDRAPEFEVTAQAGTRVTLTDAKGNTVADGIFGKQAPDFTHIYFRYPDSPTVYLASGVVRGELDPVAKNWRNHDVVSITEAEMQSIQVQQGDKAWALQRSSGTWMLDGKPADTTQVYRLVGTLAHLRADDFPDDERAMTGEIAQLTVRGATASVTLRIGALDTAAHRYLAATNKLPGVFWLSEDKVKTFLVNPSQLKPH
jgi:hypothetical protein